MVQIMVNCVRVLPSSYLHWNLEMETDCGVPILSSQYVTNTFAQYHSETALLSTGSFVRGLCRILPPLVLGNQAQVASLFLGFMLI